EAWEWVRHNNSLNVPPFETMPVGTFSFLDFYFEQNFELIPNIPWAKPPCWRGWSDPKKRLWTIEEAKTWLRYGCNLSVKHLDASEAGTLYCFEIDNAPADVLDIMPETFYVRSPRKPEMGYHFYYRASNQRIADD